VKKACVICRVEIVPDSLIKITIKWFNRESGLQHFVLFAAGIYFSTKYSVYHIL
jgi:hypothetical protein